jgi:hypothetical protein
MDARVGSREDGSRSSDAKGADRAEHDSATKDASPDSTLDSGPDLDGGTGFDSRAQTDAETLEDSGSAPDSTGADSPADAASDSTTDARPDSPADAEPDSPSDAEKDSPTDASPDSPEDAEPDSPTDTGTETGSGLVPCTTAGQTGCVQCTLSTTAPLCTPTEAKFVEFDIKKGLDTTAGAPAADSCYECLTSKGCLDDQLGDTGEECEDGMYTGPSPASGDVAQCQATLTCVLNTGCNSSDYGACYCGAATPSGTCLTDTTSSPDPAVGSSANLNPATIGGACDVEISAGLGFPITDGTDILKNITSSELAAGQVGTIFSCGIAGRCTACE